MILSNPTKILLGTLVFSAVLIGCSENQDRINIDNGVHSDPLSSPVNVESGRLSPKIPSSFQANFIQSNGKDEDICFIARKSEKWRIDSPLGDTLLNANGFYSISHKRQIYAEMPENQYAIEDAVDDATFGVLRNLDFGEMEEIGRDGVIIKYKSPDYSCGKGELLVDVDIRSGLPMRKEFTSCRGVLEHDWQAPYIYEIRNLKLEVDDSVFEIPKDYSKVSWGEYSPPLRKK